MDKKANITGDDDTHSGDQESSPILRRTCLKIVGTTFGVVSIGGTVSEGVHAETSGYGEGGYGEVPFGGISALAVSTKDATNVASTSAKLSGSLNDLDGASSADCYFEWRQVGASSWTATTKQTLSSTGSFSVEVADLSGATDYEYRATARVSDDNIDTGNTISFTTSSSNSAPAIDSYSVTEAGSPNPHCEITADWVVSDVDGNLATVTVEVVDASGSLVDSAKADISGSNATSTDSFEIKHVDGKTFDVAITATDTNGNTVNATQTVSE